MPVPRAAGLFGVPPGGYDPTVDSERQGDFKNALPDEVDDHPDSGMPRQLRARNDGADALSRTEAEVAGMVAASGSAAVYSETDMDPNAGDQRDAHEAAEDEHA